MTSAADGGTSADGPPAWLPLASEESVEWQGGPRIQTIIPSVVVGLTLVLGGLGALWYTATETGSAVLAALGVLAILGGVVLPIWSLLRVKHTEYVVTDRHLYRKSGVLGRRVTTVGYGTVQNVSYSQGITGTLFDHGTVAFDTAGGTGTELAFSNVDDPSTVQQLVERRRTRYGGGDGFGGATGASGDGSVPGTTEQWAAVREEVVALRRAVERRRG
ncbi:PH domain-containing protein [Halorientalis persicus]|jgi:membrane protein YdbS with pleckstrin-like domain|uniref:PH domain-containing protein n=1 Tax=Halorientalis persicus TaxID=1367881 RepID=A0A1H8H708_9EURY|nr:PH domain-containing protein [Halorientalis persicus]SEN52053.1 PH domain-containing protein [Halorientalis persicus]